ncbi:hypothetical protein [Roseateles sp.]|uniref:hypothetical protein n=1 Tax=Roseateles sp. TaxID=1971397 RepID=UPI00286B0A5D|nr:hypothetical protein [Roseateles sp.]
MKRIVLTVLSGMGLSLATSAQATDVGVSISVGQPGFYGQIDIGRMPQPRLIYAQPVIIERVTVQPSPVYLRVSPGHEKNWRKHCKHYGACGQNVYFVRDDWYRDVYVPRHQGRDLDRDHDHDQGERGHGKNKNKDKGKGKDHD